MISLLENNWKAHLLWIIILFLILSFPIFKDPSFYPDDYRYLNKAIVLLSGKGDVGEWTTITNTWEHLWWSPDKRSISFFRFPVILTFVIDALIWGENPFGYFITSAIIHLACSVVIYFIFRVLFENPFIGFSTGLLFAIHPVHGEALWYISGRTDSLAALFWLISFLLYVKKNDGKMYLPLSLTSFFLALLSKENSFTLLLVIIAYDLFWRNNRERNTPGTTNNQIWTYAKYIVVIAIYYIIRYSILGEFFPNTSVYPYFHTPNDPGFFLHVLVVLILYSFNLVAGIHTDVFFSADKEFFLS
ncbi:glycosyltransferase family 39 protein, partial [Candidatus Altiarchaeota archaeon]